MLYARRHVSLTVLLLAQPLAVTAGAADAEGHQVQQELQGIERDAPVSELAGHWMDAADDAIRLVLAEDGLAQLGEAKGTWKRFGRKKLRFKLDGHVERSLFRLEGERLSIDWKSGARTYVRVDTSFPKIPPALEGVGDGPVTPWVHPKDYFSFNLPHRWSVAELGEGVLLVDPDLDKSGTLDAIVFVGWGELGEEEKGRTPAQLMQRSEKEWLALLAKDGIVLRKAKTAPTRALVGDVPGAEQEWTGRTSNGEDVRLWAGAIVKRDAFLYVAALTLAGEESKYLPKAKQLFLSVVPTPPLRNVALEKGLAGSKIVSTDTGAGGSTGWSYTFHPDGSVESFWFMTGDYGIDMVADLSETEWGSYEVFGTAFYVYLKSGQVEGTVVQDALGKPVALVIAGARYSL